MSGVIASDNLVLDAEQDNGGGAVINENNPIIAWNSIVTTASVAADTEDENNPAINLANPSTKYKWIANDTTIQYVTITTMTADDVDHLAIARHNLSTVGIAASVEVDDGGGFDQVIAPVIPSDDGPLIFRWTPGPAQSVRLKLAGGSLPASIAVMFSGKLLVLQRRIYVGHIPMPMGQVVDVVGNRSENGEYLGRIVKSERKQTSVSLRYLTPTWYRTYMGPFVQSANRDSPFFFAWRPGTYPDEVGYGAFTGSVQPKNQLNNGMMNIDFQVSGIGANSL